MTSEVSTNIQTIKTCHPQHNPTNVGNSDRKMSRQQNSSVTSFVLIKILAISSGDISTIAVLATNIASNNKMTIDDQGSGTTIRVLSDRVHEQNRSMIDWVSRTNKTSLAKEAIYSIDEFDKKLFSLLPTHPTNLDDTRGKTLEEFVGPSNERVIKARIHESTHKEFGQAAQDVTITSRLAPGTKNGQKDGTILRLPIVLNS